MSTATEARAAQRPAVRDRLFRNALVALLALVAVFAPAAVGSSTAAAGAGISSGCAAPESHEELRPARPERERPRPEPARGQHLAAGGPATDGGPAAFCSPVEFASTAVDALPHPLERIPIDRN